MMRNYIGMVAVPNFDLTFRICFADCADSNMSASTNNIRVDEFVVILEIGIVIETQGPQV